MNGISLDGLGTLSLPNGLPVGLSSRSKADLRSSEPPVIPLSLCARLGVELSDTGRVRCIFAQRMHRGSRRPVSSQPAPNVE